MEVKFRIGEQVEKIAGGEVDDPHQSTYPVGLMPSVRVAFNYVHTWQYMSLTHRTWDRDNLKQTKIDNTIQFASIFRIIGAFFCRLGVLLPTWHLVFYAPSLFSGLGVLFIFDRPSWTCPLTTRLHHPNFWPNQNTLIVGKARSTSINCQASIN